MIPWRGWLVYTIHHSTLDSGNIELWWQIHAPTYYGTTCLATIRQSYLVLHTWYYNCDIGLKHFVSHNNLDNLLTNDAYPVWNIICNTKIMLQHEAIYLSEWPQITLCPVEFYHVSDPTLSNWGPSVPIKDNICNPILCY